MKSIGIISVVGAIVIAICIFYTANLKSTSIELITINNEIFESVLNNDFKGAKESALKLESIIEEKRILLGSAIDHTELDKIEINLAQMKAYIEGGKKEDAISFINSLEFLFLHLPKNYEINFQNIM